MDEKEFKAIAELLKKKDILLDTTELVHSEAYDKAVRALLTDDDGKVDYGKLKDIDTQSKFTDELKSHYLEAARDALGVSDEKGELEDELLLKAYIGVTSDYFRDQISKKRHKYTKGEHSGVVAKLIEEQDQELKPIAFRKIKEKHIPDVVREMKAEGYIDADKIRLQEAIELLDLYYRTGTISEKMVEGTVYHRKKAA